MLYTAKVLASATKMIGHSYLVGKGPDGSIHGFFRRPHQKPKGRFCPPNGRLLLLYDLSPNLGERTSVAFKLGANNLYKWKL